MRYNDLYKKQGNLHLTMKDIEKALAEIKYFLLDMDGTVYLGDELIGDMPNTLRRIRSAGKKIIYLTNNSSKTAEEYEHKLKSLGIFCEGDEVYTSGMAAAEYLNEFYPAAKVDLLGTRALKEYFANSGVMLCKRGADVCVLAYDTELTYEKLCDFCYDLNFGAKYIATHPDVNCPAPEVFVPDAGAFMAMIERSTGKTPELVIGKPNFIMGERLKKRYGARSEEFIMVGDRLHTDILFGGNCGFYTALVLSGESEISDIERSKAAPDFIWDSLNDVSRWL